MGKNCIYVILLAGNVLDICDISWSMLTYLLLRLAGLRVRNIDSRNVYAWRRSILTVGLYRPLPLTVPAHARRKIGRLRGKQRFDPSLLSSFLLLFPIFRCFLLIWDMVSKLSCDLGPNRKWNLRNNRIELAYLFFGSRMENPTYLPMTQLISTDDLEVSVKY